MRWTTTGARPRDSSSGSSTRGLATRARPMATDCCSPPDSCALIYPSLVFLPLSGGTPTGVVGQPSATGVAANYDSPDGLATAEGLYSPVGIYVDRQDTLYVGDTGNNRVVHFLKAASVVNAAVPD